MVEYDHLLGAAAARTPGGEGAFLADVVVNGQQHLRGEVWSPMKYHEFGPFSTRRGGTWFVLLMSGLSLTIVLAEGDGLLPVFFVLVATVAAEKILYQWVSWSARRQRRQPT